MVCGSGCSKEWIFDSVSQQDLFGGSWPSFGSLIIGRRGEPSKFSYWFFSLTPRIVGTIMSYISKNSKEESCASRLLDAVLANDNESGWVDVRYVPNDNSVSSIQCRCLHNISINLMERWQVAESTVHIRWHNSHHPHPCWQRRRRSMNTITPPPHQTKYSHCIRKCTSPSKWHSSTCRNVLKWFERFRL